jgi:hypothetical protein
MPLPWQRKVVHIASQVAAAVTGIDSLAPSSNEVASPPPNPDVVEAQWRGQQAMDEYHRSYFMPMTEAVELLGKSETYIRARARSGDIEMFRLNDDYFVDRWDIEHEKERIEQFPYPQQEEAPHA